MPGSSAVVLRWDRRQAIPNRIVDSYDSGNCKHSRKLSDA